MKIKCPKCRGVLQQTIFSRDISILRCSVCCGMLIDPDTIIKIRKAVRADEFFDIGHPKVGKALDKVDEMLCPSCDVPMRKETDAEQIHIKYETCPSCRRMFLDAGELIDLSQETLIDKLRDLFSSRV